MEHIVENRTDSVVEELLDFSGFQPTEGTQKSTIYPPLETLIETEEDLGTKDLGETRISTNPIKTGRESLEEPHIPNMESLTLSNRSSSNPFLTSVKSKSLPLYTMSTPSTSRGRNEFSFFSPPISSKVEVGTPFSTIPLTTTVGTGRSALYHPSPFQIGDTSSRLSKPKPPKVNNYGSFPYVPKTKASDNPFFTDPVTGTNILDQDKRIPHPFSIGKLMTPNVPPQFLGSQSTPIPNNCSYVPMGSLKPKDIEMLKLEDLGELHAASLRRVFFNSVRSLGREEQEAVQIAMNRMDGPLKLFVGSRLQNQPYPSLEWLENLLKKEFPGPLNLADAIRNLYNLEYDLTESPRTFAHRFKALYESLTTSFPTENCPKRATMLKQVICKQLPLDLRRRLELFMTEGYSEELFISELERERISYSLRIATIGAQRVPDPEPTLPRQQNSNINRNGGRSQFRPRRSCPYCQDGSYHPTRACPRNPQWGSCFDCLSTTHRKGNSECPGRQTDRTQ